MSNTTRAKANILFPNGWAADSFLLKIRQARGWEWVASSDAQHIKVRPKDQREYILIGLNKKAGNGGAVTVEMNAEKLGHGAEPIWIQIFDWARGYRCAPVA